MRPHVPKLPATFWRFCVVGGTGFITDALLLELGVAAGLRPEVARAFSILVVLQLTYALHRSYTFRAESGGGVRRWVRFLAVNLIGVAVNYGVFVLSLMLLTLEDARAERWLALVIGTAVSLLVNYTLNRRLVFPREAA